ncbi:hypothetical protein HYDPIDRAFT_28618 [Hydnomerulius pinastri MD-312]|uniref:Uncharacterized protein n=1 Tax=Hydnomerulius pinastri MD-312 TaxID=994086 RepID=A0A0C9W0D4_9AGAM|nr:hypothetical protein HYDPIDRAFT_28618 [Hydnomerulius pinastri MD-312]
MSAVLTVGSPTLAGYSLILTLLNARWVKGELFRGINYPNPSLRDAVVQVLSSLQQVPLRVHPGESGQFESLVVLPDNDNWWTAFAEELDYSHTWSIASATSIAWVVVAYILTVVDSLSDVPANIDSNGQGTGSIWLWLLPIVIGWLLLSPKCDADRVHIAYKKANKNAVVADVRDPNKSLSVTSNYGFTIDARPFDNDTASPDELRTPPVFNYARTLSWSRSVYVTSLFYRAAWRRASRSQVAVDPAVAFQDTPNNEVLPGNRRGNRAQVIHYCQPQSHYPGDIRWAPGVFFNMVVASLVSLVLQWGTTLAAFLVVWFTPTTMLGCRSLAYLIYGALSTIVWMLLVLSSILAHYGWENTDDEQGGSYSFPIPSAHVVPDTDSAGGSVSAMSMQRSDAPSGTDSTFEMSPILHTAVPTHQIQEPSESDTINAESNGASSPLLPRRDRLAARGRIASRLAMGTARCLRWIGKALAIVNAIGIIVNSIFQYASVYDNCYCDSSALGRGLTNAFNVIKPSNSDIHLAWAAWIGALALALSCSSFFVVTIYLLRDSIPS